MGIKEIKANFKDVENPNIYIVVSEFNSVITKSLLDGALACFDDFSISKDNVTVVWVPGAFEEPLIASIIAKSKKPDGIICLGAVIKGGTAHFDFVAGQNASGIMSVMLSASVPIMYGVLTTDTIEQAIDRSGAKMGNKGYDATVTLFKTLSVIKKLQ